MTIVENVFLNSYLDKVREMFKDKIELLYKTVSFIYNSTGSLPSYDYLDDRTKELFQNLLPINTDYEVFWLNVEKADRWIEYPKYYTEDMSDLVNDNVLLDNNKALDSKIVNITTTSSINRILEEVNNLDKSTLYGVLIKDTENGKVFNPLHPMIAMSLISTNIFTARKYIASIYSLSSPYDENTASDVVERLNSLYYEILSLYEDRVTNLKKACFENNTKVGNNTLRDMLGDALNNYLGVPSNLATILKEPIDLAPLNYLFDKLLKQVKNAYTYYTDKETIENPEMNVYIPLQMLSNGFVVPYYGVAQIQRYLTTREVKGLSSMTPMMSNNIGRGSNAVCTGDYDNTTRGGLLTLNISNANSAYSHTILHPEWKIWIKVCIENTLKLYKEVGWIH